LFAAQKTGELTTDALESFMTLHGMGGRAFGPPGGEGTLTAGGKKRTPPANESHFAGGVRAAGTVRTIAGPNGKPYSVAFETKLDASVWSKSRSVHLNRANAALDAALRSDPVWAAQMEETIPGLQASVAVTGRRRT